MFIPLIYFLVKGKTVIAKDKRLFVLIFGFSVLFVGGIFDFAGDVRTLDNIPLIGSNYPYHESIEDILGIVGFFLFALGVALEIRYIKKENLKEKEIIDKLQEQASRLEKYDKLKSKFIEDVSHEFRSPLCSISMSLHNVITGLMGDVSREQADALNIGQRNLNRLSRLVNDLLALSQIEAGRLPLHRKLSDIFSLANEAYLSLKPLFEEKKISFSRVSYLKNSDIWCDPDKVIQVFVNFLSNSLKYSRPESQVTVHIYDDGPNARIEVQDQGKGLTEEELSKLFNRFERLEEDKAEGAGLGLVISKELIGLHKGRVWVESKVNEGTKFIFTLPKDMRV